MEPVEELRLLPHAARAYQYALTIGGILSLAWGLVIPAIIFIRDWSLSGILSAGAILVPAATLLVLARFLRRRHAIWAAHGLWSVALALLTSILVGAIFWRAGAGRVGWVLVLVAVSQIAPLGWHAWWTVPELRRAADEERGFEPIPLDIPLAGLAPPDMRCNPIATNVQSNDNDREK